MNKPCEFCTSQGPIRVKQGEGGVKQDVHICDRCWVLLQNPLTALPLIRGNLTLALRGKVSDKTLEKQLNQFMGIISKWNKKN
jgi:hypothetical protein